MLRSGSKRKSKSSVGLLVFPPATEARLRRKQRSRINHCIGKNENERFLDSNWKLRLKDPVTESPPSPRSIGEDLEGATSDESSVELDPPSIRRLLRQNGYSYDEDLDVEYGSASAFFSFDEMSEDESICARGIYSGDFKATCDMFLTDTVEIGACVEGEEPKQKASPSKNGTSWSNALSSMFSWNHIVANDEVRDQATVDKLVCSLDEDDDCFSRGAGKNEHMQENEVTHENRQIFIERVRSENEVTQARLERLKTKIKEKKQKVVSSSFQTTLKNRYQKFIDRVRYDEEDRRTRLEFFRQRTKSQTKQQKNEERVSAPSPTVEVDTEAGDYPDIREPPKLKRLTSQVTHLDVDKSHCFICTPCFSADEETVSADETHSLPVPPSRIEGCSSGWVLRDEESFIPFLKKECENHRVQNSSKWAVHLAGARKGVFCFGPNSPSDPDDHCCWWNEHKPPKFGGELPDTKNQTERSIPKNEDLLILVDDDEPQEIKENEEFYFSPILIDAEFRPHRTVLPGWWADSVGDGGARPGIMRYLDGGESEPAEIISRAFSQDVVDSVFDRSQPAKSSLANDPENNVRNRATGENDDSTVVTDNCSGVSVKRSRGRDTVMKDRFMFHGRHTTVIPLSQGEVLLPKNATPDFVSNNCYSDLIQSGNEEFGSFTIYYGFPNDERERITGVDRQAANQESSPPGVDSGSQSNTDRNEGNILDYLMLGTSQSFQSTAESGMNGECAGGGSQAGARSSTNSTPREEPNRYPDDTAGTWTNVAPNPKKVYYKMTTPEKENVKPLHLDCAEEIRRSPMEDDAFPH